MRTQGEIGEWYEIWLDDTLPQPYFLIVTPDKDHFVVIDPHENYCIVHSDITYDAVKLWLLEDEYRKAEGRMIVGE